MSLRRLVLLARLTSPVSQTTLQINGSFQGPPGRNGSIAIGLVPIEYSISWQQRVALDVKGR